MLSHSYIKIETLNNPIRWKRPLIKLLIQCKTFCKLEIKGNVPSVIDTVCNKQKQTSVSRVTVKALLLK